MRNIYTFGGRPARRNWTVADLRAVKGKQVLTEVSAYTAAQAAAAEAAGIDIIATDCPLTAEVRMGAPETFVCSAPSLTNYRSDEAVIEAERIRALRAWKEDVSSGAYPSQETSISMPVDELDKFHNALEQQS